MTEHGHRRSLEAVTATSKGSHFVGPSASDERTKDQIEPSDRHLNVPEILRIASPDSLSELSIYGDRVWPGISSLQSQNQTQHLSQSPASPHGFKGKAQGFWQRNYGLTLVLIAQIFGILMNVTTRLLELEGNNGRGLHPFQILLARMSITVLLASLYMWYAKTPDFPLGARGVRLLLVARGVGGFFGVFGMYYSLMYLDMSDATVLTFLAPSISCWACSYLIKEPFTRMEKMGALVSLFGVVLIARPTALFEAFNHHSVPAAQTSDLQLSPANSTPLIAAVEATNHKVTPEQRLMAVGFAMLGVFGAACAYTTLRWIGKRAHPLISTNYFAIWCTIVSMTMLTILPDIGFVLPANLKEWGYLIFLGVCGFIMQYLLSAGLAAEKSSRATNMVYTQMLFALVGDKLVFDTNPGLLSILGSSLILGSTIYVAIQKGSTPSNEKNNSGHLSCADADEERGLMENMELDDQEPSIRASNEVDTSEQMQLPPSRE